MTEREGWYTKLGDEPNVWANPDGVPTYIIPDDAIPNGGYVVVNGCRVYFQSAQRMREREERAREEYESLHRAIVPREFLKGILAGIRGR